MSPKGWILEPTEISKEFQNHDFQHKVLYFVHKLFSGKGSEKVAKNQRKMDDHLLKSLVYHGFRTFLKRKNETKTKLCWTPPNRGAQSAPRFGGVDIAYQIAKVGSKLCQSRHELESDGRVCLERKRAVRYLFFLLRPISQGQSYLPSTMRVSRLNSSSNT